MALIDIDRKNIRDLLQASEFNQLLDVLVEGTKDIKTGALDCTALTSVSLSSLVNVEAEGELIGKIDCGSF